MGEDVISEIQKDYVFALARDGKRADNRAFDEYRQIEIWTNIVQQAEGSARVKIGATDVIVGVKMAPGEPYADSPNDGVLTTSAELIPMASPDFEAGPPGQASIELARVVDRGIRESKTIDTQKLCIAPGEKVWVSFIDLHVVDYDGNLFDACSLATMAALLTAKVPASKHGVGEDTPMPLNHYPIMTTAIKVGQGIVFDPGLIEDKVGGPRLSVSFDEHGDIRAMQKGLEGGFSKSEILHIIENGRRKSKEIREILFKKTGVSPPY